MHSSPIKQHEHCVDIIAQYKGKYVLIERLSEPRGLAWPGGRREHGERVNDAALREFREETGLELRIDGTLGTYDALGRDPRGPKSSDVVFGRATGIIRAEAGKTIVHLFHAHEISANAHRFVFDHAQMWRDYRIQAYTRKS